MIHACGVVWEDYAITIPLEAVECMEKLNTFTFYQLGSLINSVGHIPTKDTQLGDLFFVLNRVRSMLSRHIGDKGILPESSKRAAIVLLRVLHDIGIPAEGQDLTKVDFTASVPGYKLTSVAQRARELETVLANDLPGLATYRVLTKGIYSTTDLIEHASNHLDSAVDPNVKKDYDQAGRCLAFELFTACGFHTLRAIEAVARCYRTEVTGDQTPDTGITLGVLINDLRNHHATEDEKSSSSGIGLIIGLLGRVNALFGRPLMHPELVLDAASAKKVFDLGATVIATMQDDLAARKKTAEPIISDEDIPF